MSFAHALGNTTVLAKGPGVSRPPPRALVCNATARPQRDASVAEKAFGALVGGMAGVTLGMASMTYTPPAQAGVVLVEQEKKRVFNSPPETKEAKEAKKAEKKAEKKPEASGESGFDLPLGLVALPLSVVGIAGAGFAAKTLDDGFLKFMDGALIRDCNDYVGYEVELKTDAPKAGKGTKRVRKAA